MRKGKGGVWEAGNKGVGSTIPKVKGSGRTGGNYTTLCKTNCNKKGAQRWEPTKIGQELGLKGTGRRRFNPPPPVPPPPV